MSVQSYFVIGIVFNIIAIILFHICKKINSKITDMYNINADNYADINILLRRQKIVNCFFNAGTFFGIIGIINTVIYLVLTII
jgi:hypothetical protein